MATLLAWVMVTVYCLQGFGTVMAAEAAKTAEAAKAAPTVDTKVEDVKENESED